MKNAIIITIFLFILGYLTGVFCYADFNITQWDKDGRGFITGIMGFCILFALSMNVIIQDNKKSDKQ